MYEIILEVNKQPDDSNWEPGIISINGGPFVVELEPRFKLLDLSHTDYEYLPGVEDYTDKDYKEFKYTHYLVLIGLRKTVELYFIYESDSFVLPTKVTVKYEKVCDDLPGIPSARLGVLKLDTKSIDLDSVVERDTTLDRRATIIRRYNDKHLGAEYFYKFFVDSPDYGSPQSWCHDDFWAFVKNILDDHEYEIGPDDTPGRTPVQHRWHISKDFHSVTDRDSHTREDVTGRDGPLYLEAMVTMGCYGAENKMLNDEISKFAFKIGKDKSTLPPDMKSLNRPIGAVFRHDQKVGSTRKKVSYNFYGALIKNDGKKSYWLDRDGSKDD